jgi:hypothetical protein
MWILGQKLKDAYNYLARHHDLDKFTWSQGLAPRTAIVFKDQQGNESPLYRSIFQQECVRRGVLFNAAPKICLRHTDVQIEWTIGVYEEAFQVLTQAYSSDDPRKLLLGQPVEPVFRRSDY